MVLPGLALARAPVEMVPMGVVLVVLRGPVPMALQTAILET